MGRNNTLRRVHEIRQLQLHDHSFLGRCRTRDCPPNPLSPLYIARRVLVVGLYLVPPHRVCVE